MCTYRSFPFALAAVAAMSIALVTSPGSAQENASPQESEKRFGFGEEASQELIEEWAVAIPPDGEHLPPGGATAEQGEDVYNRDCAACHGEDLQGIEATGGAALIGGRETLSSGMPTKKTVESYWPYATTVFDYVRRAMPFTSPGSLTDEEVYAVTAYILHRGDIISRDERMDAESLPEVEMPNEDGFVPDPRPDVIHYR